MPTSHASSRPFLTKSVALVARPEQQILGPSRIGLLESHLLKHPGQRYRRTQDNGQEADHLRHPAVSASMR